ncbi:MAG: transposase [Myxococcota bacterium]
MQSLIARGKLSAKALDVAPIRPDTSKEVSGMEAGLTIKPLENGRRRRFTVEQKLALLAEAERPRGSISETARRFGIAPSVMFLWKRTMDDATKQGLKGNEKVVPEREVRELKDRIKDLERVLGRKTMDPLEILKDALRIAGERSQLARKVVEEGRWPVKRVADALEVSRPHLSKAAGPG